MHSFPLYARGLSNAWGMSFVLLAAPLSGCTGAVGDSDGTPATEIGPDGTPIPAKTTTKGPTGMVPGSPSDPVATEPGKMPVVPGAPPAPLSSSRDLRGIMAIDDDVGGGMALRGLTRDEYNNTVSAVLGDTSGLASQWGVEVKGRGGFLEPRPVSGKEINEHMEAASVLAARAKGNLPKLMACDVTKMGEDVCAKSFVTSLGRRAFRRPLLAVEETDFLGLWSAARKTHGLTFDDSISLVIEAMLQSPSFIYHWELGPQEPRVDGKSVVRLTSYEVAARLSYFLTQAPPDDLLSAAADSGKILEPAELKSHAARLMGGNKAKEVLQDFVAQILGVSDFGLSDDALTKTMDRSRRAFVEKTLWTGKGTPKELLLDSNFFVNAPLATLYGLTGVKGDALVAQAMDPTKRFGLLTHADFLTKTGKGNESLPPRRGHAIWTGVLCGEFPSGVPPVPPEINRDAMDTVREHFEKKVEPLPCAAACHNIVDNAGFAFENYGGATFREKEANNKPINSSGALGMPFGGTLTYKGARDFVEGVVASEELKQCMARQMFRMGTGREEALPDAGGIKAVYEGFKSGGEDLKTLAVAIVTTKSFTHRRLNAGEKAQ